MALLIEKLARQNQFEQVNLLLISLYFSKATQIIPYLTALVKGLLKPEDIHVPQVKIILINALNSNQEPVKNTSFQIFKEEIQVFLNSLHVIAELDKVIEQYSPEVCLN